MVQIPLDEVHQLSQVLVSLRRQKEVTHRGLRLAIFVHPTGGHWVGEVEVKQVQWTCIPLIDDEARIVADQFVLGQLSQDVLLPLHESLVEATAAVSDWASSSGTRPVLALLVALLLPLLYGEIAIEKAHHHLVLFPGIPRGLLVPKYALVHRPLMQLKVLVEL